MVAQQRIEKWNSFTTKVLESNLNFGEHIFASIIFKNLFPAEYRFNYLTQIYSTSFTVYEGYNNEERDPDSLAFYFHTFEGISLHCVYINSKMVYFEYALQLVPYPDTNWKN